MKRRSNRIRNRKGTPKAAKNGKRLFRASDESLNNRPKRLKNSMASSKAQDRKWLMNGKGLLGVVAVAVGLIIVITGKLMLGLW